MADSELTTGLIGFGALLLERAQCRPQQPVAALEQGFRPIGALPLPGGLAGGRGAVAD